MEFLGSIPLWTLLLIGLIIVFVAWKIIKFAIKVFVALLIFFGLLIGLDIIGFFGYIQNLISSFM